MNSQFISTLLENVSTEQLPGVVGVSTLLCLACLLITRLLQHRSASMTSSVWQATCSAILVSAIVLALMPGIPLRDYLTFQRREVRVPIVSRRPLETTSPSSPMDLPGQQAEASTITQQAVAESVDPPTLRSDNRDEIADAKNQSSAVAVASIETSNVAVDESWTLVFRAVKLFSGAWLLVLSILLGRFLRSVVACRKIIARSCGDIPSQIGAAAETACQRLDIAWVPQMLLSEEVQVPFTAGIYRPVIVLPKSAIEWSPEKLQMVLAHELAHIERHDVFWHWIGRMAICVAWFNPLVWWAARRGVLDRERACDDRVIGCGFGGPDYGQCLVEIAAAVSGRIMPVTAAVSMAEPPMKLRLQSILSTAIDRRRESKSYRGFVMATFVGLAMLLGIIRPLATATAASSVETNQTTIPTTVMKQPEIEVKAASSKPAEPANPEENLIEITNPVSGLITDEAGTPIAGVNVLVKVRDFGGGTTQTFRMITIGSWQTTTDETGRYTVDISNIGRQPSRYEIGVEAADKAGFVQQRGSYWPSLNEVAAGKEIRTVKLSRGRRVTGQLLASNGQPSSAVVRAVGKSQFDDHWFLSGQQTAGDGRLEIDLPVDSDARLVLYADDHAPTLVSVAPNQNDLGRVQLRHGSIVSGTVIHQNDKPLKGVVVVLDSMNHELQGMAASWSRVAVTDDKGEFRMLSAFGSCRLSVQESTQRQDRIGGNESLTGIRPPLVMPIELNLAEERQDQQVVLKESESYRISGIARWDDGEPAKDFEVVGGVMVQGAGIDLVTVVTDANGQYALSLPQGSDAYVMGFGDYRDIDRTVWYMAKGTAPAPATGGGQIVSISKLMGDIQDVNWELRPHRESPPKTAAQKQAQQTYAALQAEDQQQMELYMAAPPEDKDRLDPRNVMAAKYLAFEEQFRGEDEAVQAARHVLQGANSVADPGSAVAKARNEMVERLISNYLGHEDLATTFGSLSAGPPVSRADDLLRMSSGRSPHPIVRAAALLTRAKRAKELLRAHKQLPELEQHVAMLKDDSTLHPTGTSPDSIKRMAEAAQQRLDELKAIDEADLRAQAGRWLDAIEKDYADLIRPHTFDHTFGQDAKALRFAIDHVNVGKPAPQMEATGVNGKPFRLSEHRGKVVVLTFQQDMGNKAENLPHQNLAELFKDQPVELVTIVATEKQDAFVENSKAASYHGTLIWEPLRGPYHSNWGVTGFPTTYIIDQTGILHAVPVGMEDVSGLVKALIKAEPGARDE